MTIQARPTVYRGIAMRSRLEASYAQWLDEIGVLWRYEPNAYAGLGGQYLPDFIVSSPPGDRGRAAGMDVIEVRPTLETAWLALDRIVVVWESRPDAWLIVDVPGVGFYSRAPHFAGWRWVSAPWVGIPRGRA